MSQKFQRKIEDFVCAKCGAEVKGNGYTNHCPKCLWSKHVDIHPGDRAEACNGLMEPIAVDLERHGFSITYRCLKCGFVGKNKSRAEDDSEIILKIANKNINNKI